MSRKMLILICCMILLTVSASMKAMSSKFKQLSIMVDGYILQVSVPSNESSNFGFGAIEDSVNFDDERLRQRRYHYQISLLNKYWDYKGGFLSLYTEGAMRTTIRLRYLEKPLLGDPLCLDGALELVKYALGGGDKFIIKIEEINGVSWVVASDATSAHYLYVLEGRYYINITGGYINNTKDPDSDWYVRATADFQKIMNSVEIKTQS